MMARKQGGLLSNNYRRLQQAGFMMVVILAKRLVRFMVVGAFVLGSLWLLYVNVWRPLKQEVSLSSGVALNSPRLDVEVLRSINSAGAERAGWARRDFSSWSGVFTRSGEGLDSEMDDR